MNATRFRHTAARLRFVACALIAAATAANAKTEVYSFANLNRVMPDGSRSGLVDVRNVASGIRSVSSVRVRLNIAGQFNGDLYAYIRQVSAQTTNFCVLLNRPGRSAAGQAGYSDGGLNITFDSSASNDIHVYRSITNLPPGSLLAGTWQPDGRNVDPLSVLDSTSRGAGLGSFTGVDAGGEWALFVADVDSGATNMLVGWELELAGAIDPPLTWATPDPITYGTALGSTQLNASAGSVSGTFAYQPPAGTVLNAGPSQTLSVTFVPADSSSYVPAAASVLITVLKAPLTVASSDTNRFYGDANPLFTGTIVGLQNGDHISASYTCAATAQSPVGSYAIVPTPAGTSLGNYLVKSLNGMLMVNAAALTVTAQSTTRPYGTPNPVFTGSVAGIKNSDAISVSYNCAAAMASPIGSYDIVPSPSGPNLGNYAVTTVKGTLTITPDWPPTMSILGMGDRLYRLRVSGTPNRSCAVQYSPVLLPATWTTITNGILDATGVLECTDLAPTQAPGRLFRAVYQ